MDEGKPFSSDVAPEQRLVANRFHVRRVRGSRNEDMDRLVRKVSSDTDVCHTHAAV